MNPVAWLQLMPVIELATGAPVIPLCCGVPVGDGATVRTVLSVGHELTDGRPAAALWDGATLQEVFYPLEDLRVDLTDAAGFGHALRVLVAFCKKHEIKLIRVLSKPCLMELLAPWATDGITDEHRLALARGLHLAHVLASVPA